MTETESGLDVLVTGARPNPAAIGTFAAQAGVLGVARLTADGESIALGGTPEVDLSGAKVKLPPGAFLQASREAEAELVKLMLEGTEGAKRVADLFAGLGTFSFALARTSAVDAYEADDAALACSRRGGAADAQAEAGQDLGPRSVPRATRRQGARSL